MAKVCESGMPESIYDWDSWLDGQVWELEKGIDFHIGITSIRSMARTAAHQRGLEMKTRSKGDSLFIQATERS
jgi:hypothetical protein